MLLTISGSARPDSSNMRLLVALPALLPMVQFEVFDIHRLPLFTDQPSLSIPGDIRSFRAKVSQANGVIIATPEYAHNLPAALKNALEWLVASGELAHKPVLPITFTPHPPRGEKCMQSLCWTLAAMDAQILAQLPLYQSELTFAANGKLAPSPEQGVLKEAIALFPES